MRRWKTLDQFQIPVSKYQPSINDITSQAKANIAAQQNAGKILSLGLDLRTGVCSIFIMILSTDLEMISYQIQNTIPIA
jgi:hypothetical protein